MDSKTICTLLSYFLAIVAATAGVCWTTRQLHGYQMQINANICFSDHHFFRLFTISIYIHSAKFLAESFGEHLDSLSSTLSFAAQLFMTSRSYTTNTDLSFALPPIKSRSVTQMPGETYSNPGKVMLNS